MPSIRYRIGPLACDGHGASRAVAKMAEFAAEKPFPYPKVIQPAGDSFTVQIAGATLSLGLGPVAQGWV